jgi:hypothetical protein
MGYSHFTKKKIDPYLFNGIWVVDLGSQNDYATIKHPAPYISEWYEEHWDARYACIDLNGENNAYQYDLAYPLPGHPRNNNHLVVDAGTSEHVGIDHKFSWDGIYNCWLNKHNLLLIGGIMYNTNPKTGNWPLHGYNYYTKQFYHDLCANADYEILELGENPAMGNDIDGWEVYCILRKTGERFPTLEQFKTFDLRQS